jgi:hypothetical protein
MFLQVSHGDRKGEVVVDELLTLRGDNGPSQSLPKSYVAEFFYRGCQERGELD